MTTSPGRSVARTALLAAALLAGAACARTTTYQSEAGGEVAAAPKDAKRVWDEGWVKSEKTKHDCAERGGDCKP